MSVTAKFHLLAENISVIITMAFGAFIAGSSPEGSAAIAYPVFTLFLNIEPTDARNFAFAIQSIGMTAASIFILSSKIKIDWTYIRLVSVSGAAGLIIGMYFVAPNIQGPLAKLTFVSIWMSFGLIMLFDNFSTKRVTIDKMELASINDIVIILAGGFTGGIISSVFGTGINMLTFCLLVIYFKVNEKIATPSSIIIMTFETIIGFFWHHYVFQDMSEKSYRMWLSAIPVVVFFAPLGTYLMNKTPRKLYNNFLYTLFILQYIGAVIVLKPKGENLILTTGVILTGLIVFAWLKKKRS
jgi:uncharacterized membrane protein YfcA